MIAKNNEEKRNQLWRIVISVTSIVIIIIAAFFVIKLFTANPVEGTWRHEDGGIVLTIKGNGTAILEWPEEFEETTVTVGMRYDLDKDMKIFTLREDTGAVPKITGKSADSVDTEKVASLVGLVKGTYEYSIEQRKLILTDREYGSQMIFDKK